MMRPDMEGLMLLQINSGITTRIDERFWKTNPEGIGGRVELVQNRLLAPLFERGLVEIKPNMLNGKDGLVLTPAGAAVLIEFAFRRAEELAQEGEEARPAAIHPATAGSTRRELVYQLTGSALDISRDLAIAEAQASGNPDAVGKAMGNDDPTVGQAIHDFIASASPGSERMGRFFKVAHDLAEAAMVGLKMGDMPAFAAWGADIAAEAMTRAPSMDWEVGEGDGPD